MSKTLVLAEKPSVGRDIARVLKCHKKIKWSIRRKSIYCDLGIRSFGNIS